MRSKKVHRNMPLAHDRFFSIPNSDKFFSRVYLCDRSYSAFKKELLEKLTQLIYLFFYQVCV